MPPPPTEEELGDLMEDVFEASQGGGSQTGSEAGESEEEDEDEDEDEEEGQEKEAGAFETYIVRVHGSYARRK